jgi:hypothetical protein
LGHLGANKRHCIQPPGGSRPSIWFVFPPCVMAFPLEPLPGFWSYWGPRSGGTAIAEPPATLLNPFGEEVSGADGLGRGDAGWTISSGGISMALEQVHRHRPLRITYGLKLAALKGLKKVAGGWSEALPPERPPRNARRTPVGVPEGRDHACEYHPRPIETNLLLITALAIFSDQSR